MTARDRFKAAARQTNDGCPLFEGRDLADFDQLEGEQVTLEDAYPMNGDNGHYYVVTFKESKDLFFFSCKALTDILDKASLIASEEQLAIAQVIDGTVIEVKAPVKTKNGRKFRPVDIVE